MVLDDSGNVETRLRDLIRGPLQELLLADGGGIELISWDGARCTVRLSGRFRGCPGTPLVTEEILKPMIRKLLGENADVVVQAF